MRRTLAATLIAGLMLALALLAAAPATAQEAGQRDDTTSTLPPPPRDDSIIVEPFTGEPPADEGDRGGALQAGVFLAIVVGVGTVAALGVRESRRKRAEAMTPPLYGSNE